MKMRQSKYVNIGDESRQSHQMKMFQGNCLLVAHAIDIIREIDCKICNVPEIVFLRFS